jgi:hypothetical protein
MTRTNPDYRALKFAEFPRNVSINYELSKNIFTVYKPTMHIIQGEFPMLNELPMKPWHNRVQCIGSRRCKTLPFLINN